MSITINWPPVRSWVISVRDTASPFRIHQRDWDAKDSRTSFSAGPVSATSKIRHSNQRRAAVEDPNYAFVAEHF